MVLSELQAAVYDECNYASSPATAITTRVTRFLNEGLRALIAEPGLARVLDSDSPYTFASVASQARYVLPEAVARILGISERTNDLALGAMSMKAYRQIEPDPASVTGTPVRYVPIGRVAVATQPADASEIFVKSTAAGDTGTAYIEGTITGGYTRTASVSMTGVTAVSLSASITSFTEITDFYLSANAVGTVTLLEDSGVGAELARITIGQKRPRYTGLYLWPTPASAVTYYVDHRRELVELANATDEPPLPTDYHPMLVAYAVAREFEKTDDERRPIAEARYQRFLSRLKYALVMGDELPVAGRAGRGVGHSRLGAFFPADSYRRG